MYCKCIIYYQFQTLKVQISPYCVQRRTSVYWFCPPTFFYQADMVKFTNVLLSFVSHNNKQRPCDVTWHPRNSVISIIWLKKNTFWRCNMINSCRELPLSRLGVWWTSSRAIQHRCAKWPSPNLLAVHTITITDLSFLLTDSNNSRTVVVYTIEMGAGVGGGLCTVV